jgi:hypothetical protein
LLILKAFQHVLHLLMPLAVPQHLVLLVVGIITTTTHHEVHHVVTLAPLMPSGWATLNIVRGRFSDLRLRGLVLLFLSHRLEVLVLSELSLAWVLNGVTHTTTVLI